MPSVSAKRVPKEVQLTKDTWAKIDEQSYEIGYTHGQKSAEKQGEWIRKEDDEAMMYWHECSECGARPPKDQWKNEWHSPYCPNCGTMMVNKKMKVEIPLKRRGITYCDECVYCSVQNTKYLYAICQRHGIEFKPFEDDTRSNFCSWAKMKGGTE